jgi:hypothetical protein
MTPMQKLQAEFMNLRNFPKNERKYLMNLISELIDEEKLIIMKSYADGIEALRKSISTDELYNSYLEYYNQKQYNVHNKVY